MTSIATVWAAIESWCEASSPGLLAALNGPASRADIDALVASGLPVPPEFVESLARHDGEADDVESGLFAGSGLLLSAARIPDVRDMLRDAVADLPDDVGGLAIGPVRTVAYDERWLPIAERNGDVIWFLDFDPAPGGTAGQVIRVDLECGEWVVCAPSFESYLAAYLDELRAGRVVDEDGEPIDEQPWPPLALLPALQAGVVDAAMLEALAEAGRWDVVAEVRDRVALDPAQRARLDVRAALHEGDVDAALRALDALPKPASASDVLLRADVHEARGSIEEALAAIEAGLRDAEGGALRVRRARLLLDAAEHPPGSRGRDVAAQLEWLAGPAGQQSLAIARERALADYDAALAIEGRDEWRVERAQLLLDAERWDEAIDACQSALDRLAGRDDRRANDLRGEVEGLLEQAQARGADQPDADDLLSGMNELLEALAGTLGEGTTASNELRGVRDTLAGLRDAEADERARLDAEPGSTRRRAREVAEQVARHHADSPERFATFDAGELDAKARRFYDGARDALAGLGFSHLADVEPVRNTETTGKRVLLRAMLSPDRRTAAAIWRLAGPFATYEVVELESELDDGRVLITNNSGSANPFQQPRGIEMSALPLGTGVDVIVRTHAARIADGPAARAIPNLDALLALQERQRVLKREFARERGWISDTELRGMLGGSYGELADAVREELAKLA